jgi:predicted transcriptional regulator
MLLEGPITADELLEAARVTRRTAQRTLADLYRSGWAERRLDAGRLVYYRAPHEKRARRVSGKAMTPKRQLVLDLLRRGEWRTTTELREILGCTQTEPHRIASDLVAMGLAQKIGAVDVDCGRRPAIYAPAGEEARST